MLHLVSVQEVIMRVIAKAYRDRPLDRVTVGEDGGVIFIANPAVDKAVRNTIGEGVGFPRRCVFAFDPDLFESLSEAWASADDVRLAALWERAVPLHVAEAA